MRALLPPFALLLSLAVPARGERPFHLWAAAGADYYQTLLRVSPDDPGYETSWSGANAAVRFSSALWSRRILQYSVWVNAEQGKLDYGETQNDSARLGYGLELRLFPHSPNQFRLLWGKGTYDYTSESVQRYDEKEDLLGARGILWGWFLDYERRHFLREGWNLDDRTFDKGTVAKHWTMGPSQLKLELRHQSDDYAFFRYANRTDTAGLYWSGPVGDGGNVNATAILQRFAFADEDLGYDDTGNLMRLTAAWNQPWNWRWETQAALDGGKSDRDSGLDASFRTRYRLTSPLRWDLLVGFISAQQDGRSGSFPYYGTGLYFFDTWGTWRLIGEAGVRLFGKNTLEDDREQRDYYASGGISWSGKSMFLSLDLNYQDLSLEFVQDLPGEPNPEAPVRLTRNNTLVKFEGTRRLWASGSLRLTSMANQYRIEEGSAMERVSSFSHQLDLLLPRGSVGLRFVDYRQEGTRVPYDFTSWDLHTRYALNTHLTLDAYYLRRDRMYQGRGEQETEIQAAFLYVVGKFHFSLQFHDIEATSDIAYREDRVVRAVLKRWFGDA